MKIITRLCTSQQLIFFSTPNYFFSYITATTFHFVFFMVALVQLLSTLPYCLPSAG